MRSEDMRPFEPDRACPKCLSGEVGTEYEAQSSGGTNPLGWKVPPHPERLRRECECGYVWYERTADAEEDQ